MTHRLMSGGLAVLVMAGPLVLAALVLSRRQDPSPAFRTGPLWAWCPAEGRRTPHHLDVGSRTCRSCKSTTTNKEAAHD